ncbi:MAG: hypothetical protein JXA33_13385 [Anaerolineae bacterium]|nr:hypothetical protein [Anaerolineae bacterium]
MKQGLSRRDFLRLTALSAAGAFLAGCKTPATEAPKATEAIVAEPPKAEPVKIDYVANWGDQYTVKVWDALRELPELQEYLGDNEIEVTSIGGDAMTTRVAAGTPPDGASNVDYVQYMSRGMLVPVEAWVSNSDKFKKEDHIESVWDNAFYKGKMYGVPANENWVWYGLNYNARLVEEAGLDPDTPPATWDETLDWHKALTKFDDAGNMIQLGLDPYDAIANEPDFWALSWGWQWFHEETTEFDLDNEMMVAAMKTGAEFYKVAGPDNMVAMRQVEGQGTWGGSYNAEVQAMIIEGYWHPGETVTTKPEVGEYNRTTWAPVPASKKGRKIQGAGGHYVVFFKESVHPEPMFKIAEFLNTHEACAVIFEKNGWLPSRIPFIKTVDANKYPGLSFYLVDIDETTDWLRGGRRCPIHWFVTSAFGELREAVYRDQMTAEQAAAELQQRTLDEWEAQELD